MPFTSLGVSSQLNTTLQTLGFKKPYPIQEKAIPVILKNKDVLGISATGSGKTLSYVLPAIMQLQADNSPSSRNIKALILVPTRELAIQVKEVFQQFSHVGNQIKTMAVYGGVSINPQMKNMMGVQVLIATPGRLIDLIQHNAVKLNKTELLILDEADKMLTQDFEVQMKEILPLLPVKRQNLLFSATLSEKVADVKQLILNNPEVIKVETERTNLDTIQQTAYEIETDSKGVLLRHLIKSKNMYQVLIFTSSGFKADHVAHKLRKNGISAEALHSKKTQGKRTSAMQQFKKGEITALIATDVLARGIDIAFLPFVVNYELPRSPKDFVHRIGRTGRAENPGEAITLVSPEDEHHFKVIQKKMKRWVDRINGNDMLKNI